MSTGPMVSAWVSGLDFPAINARALGENLLRLLTKASMEPWAWSCSTRPRVAKTRWRGLLSVRTDSTNAGSDNNERV